MTIPDDVKAEAWCELLHDAYEAAAAEEGWATQERSRKPWANVPEANKATMRKAVAALAPAIERATIERCVDVLMRMHNACVAEHGWIAGTTLLQAVDALTALFPEGDSQ